MERIEIIANRSVQDDIIGGLEAAIPDFYYTVMPVVHGSGRQQRKLGTTTWPEENFLLLAYVSDENARTAREVVAQVKTRFPKEGIKIFAVPAISGA